jgi:CreA protein
MDDRIIELLYRNLAKVTRPAVAPPLRTSILKTARCTSRPVSLLDTTLWKSSPETSAQHIHTSSIRLMERHKPCTVPERGGVKGWLGVAEEVSDISLACRQIGPIRFKSKFAQGDDVFRKRRSLFFKKMQIVRGCDTKRNVLVYMVYSDRLIEGSPKNSTSSVPIMPWGQNDQVQRCEDFVDDTEQTSES